MTRAPAPRPCISCPYRRDVPAGLWAESEYVKLPPYDQPIHAQAEMGLIAAFYCHQNDGRLCAGWIGCHGIETLAIRILAGSLTDEEALAIVNYKTDVPLFASGEEAAQHGMSGIAEPDDEALRMIAKLARDPRRSWA